ncbi:MgtC/SapB family protein [Haladaptatus sp. ZSTT2]|uniref:MgtC/SapB family protein n=1 Tax=Haladaptatus sp. ZSTT2 TaxID=3120515 RepID=UPI00300E96B8
MTDFVAQLALAPLDSTVVRIALAGALGLFLGLEREWSQKSAGIRTFSLTSLLAAVFTILDTDLLLVVGGLLIIVQGVLLAFQGLKDEEKGLSLTTSTSMLVAYGVGSLVASGLIIEGVAVAMLSSLLLVLKRELHSFAWGLSREEVRSTTEFAILAFVIFPLLPSEPIGFDLNGIRIAAEPQVVWLMVVTVAGIGIANYAIVKSYGGRGIAVTGFFGGLASSTAVVGTMMDHVRQRPDATSYAVAAILLADAAMALRNLLIAIGFTLSTERVLVGAAAPLGAVILCSLLVAAYTADWSQKVEMKLDNPFSLRNALGFGAMFLVIIVAGGLAEAQFGTIGFYVTAVLSGLVSSAGVTTSTVVLYRTGGLPYDTAIVGILIATASSILVKAALVAFGPSRKFALRVGIWSAVLLVAATVMTLLVTF